MSVIVSGMDMPRNCWECRFKAFGGTFTCVAAKGDGGHRFTDIRPYGTSRAEWCPLEEYDDKAEQVSGEDELRIYPRE